MKTIVMEHFNDIIFHKSGPANEQHTNHSLISLAEVKFKGFIFLKIVSERSIFDKVISCCFIAANSTVCYNSLQGNYFIVIT